MTKQIISVKEICKDNIYTRDDGKPLYERIKNCLTSDCPVMVDFEGREIASESFLDEAIVEHFLHPVTQDAESKIGLKNVSAPDQMLLQRIFVYRKRLEKAQAAMSVRDAKSKSLKKKRLIPK